MPGTPSELYNDYDMFARRLYQDPEPPAMSAMTFYELQRSLIRAAKWTQENENTAIELIDHLESIGFFGSMADTIKSKEVKP